MGRSFTSALPAPSISTRWTSTATTREEDNPLALKADFVLSLCELVVGGKEGLQPVEKTVIDRCVHTIYRQAILKIPSRKICRCWKICTTPC